MTLLAILLTLFASTVIHVSTIAIVGIVFGTRPTEVNFGYGPLILKYGVIHVKPILLGGSVRYRDSRESKLAAAHLEEALDRQPLWKHITVLILPNLVVLVGGSLMYGANALEMTATIWSQLVLCALGPLSTAQEQLGSFFSFAEFASPKALIGWGLILVGSLALLPVGGSAVGQLITEIISGRRMPNRSAERFNNWTIFIYLLVLVSWGVAIVLFLWNLVWLRA